MQLDLLIKNIDTACTTMKSHAISSVSKSLTIRNWVIGHYIVEYEQNGKDITLSVDAQVQSKLYELMEELAKDRDFSGGAGVIMSIDNGELLALASFPEYDSNILSDGGDAGEIKRWRQDARKPFLNRVVSGLYTPGSVVKTSMTRPDFGSITLAARLSLPFVPFFMT